MEQSLWAMQQMVILSPCETRYKQGSSTSDKVECLRQQYESAYTLPNKTFLKDDPQILFNSKDASAQCSAEEVHECEDDIFESEPALLFVHGDSEEAFRRRNPGKPVKSDIFFDHMDVIDAIGPPTPSWIRPKGPNWLARGSEPTVV